MSFLEKIKKLDRILRKKGCGGSCQNAFKITDYYDTELQEITGGFVIDQGDDNFQVKNLTYSVSPSDSIDWYIGDNGAGDIFSFSGPHNYSYAGKPAGTYTWKVYGKMNSGNLILIYTGTVVWDGTVLGIPTGSNSSDLTYKIEIAAFKKVDDLAHAAVVGLFKPESVYVVAGVQSLTRPKIIFKL